MLRRILTVTAFLLTTLLPAFSQNTLTETAEGEQRFNSAMELVVREKYAGAKQAFEDYISYARNENKEDNLRVADAEYYRAHCALNLFNPDAELLFQQFIRQYPWHSKADQAYYELGNFFYNNKKYQKTIDYLEKVNKSKLSQENQRELQFKLGYAYFSQKEFDKALEYFNEIKNYNHSYTYAASYYAGYLELKNGEYDEALKDLKDAEGNDAYSPVVPYLLANVYYQQEKYDKLIEYSEAALKREDIQEKDELYLLLAEAHFKKENYEKAAEFFTNYAKNRRGKPSDPIQYRLGFSQYISGNYEEAINNLKPIASNNDALGQTASYYLGLSYLKTGNKQFAMIAFQQAAKGEFSQKIKEQAVFNYAKVNADLSNFNEAISALKYFNRNFPKSEYAQQADELLGEAFLKTSNYTEAINYIESLQNRSLRLNASYQRVTFYKGVEEFNNKNFEQAVKMFDKSAGFTIDKDIYLAANYWKGEALSIMKQYDEAVNSYAKVFRNASSSNEYHIKSRYGIAYAYLNNDKYDKALEHFTEYVSRVEDGDKRMFYDDAILRIADLHAFNKNYEQALAYYNKAIESRNPELDYAQYKKGVVLAFQDGKKEEAIENFNKVLELYPSSLYFDDALYRKAEIILGKGEFKEAVALFSKLITEQPTSPYIPYALNFRAIAYGNLNSYSQAIEDYKRIIFEYPTEPIAIEALAGLQDVLSRADRTEEFADVREEFVKSNPDTASLVSIDYDAARSWYNNQKYERAIQAFTNYLEKYPESPNNPDARYFLAESYLKSDKPELAAETFQKVIDEQKSRYYTRSILRLADLYYNQGNYELAKDYYQTLLKNAENPKVRSISWASLMETYYKLDNLDSVEFYANQILEYSKYSLDANKASLHLGKVAYSRGNFENAIDHFITTINMAKDENAAEAKYMIAKIMHEQEKYKQSLEMLYDLNNTYYNYDKWLGKSFLLIAENFIAMDEVFQAKATLQSIVEKSTHTPSVEEAKKKLAELEENETKEEGDTNE